MRKLKIKSLPPNRRWVDRDEVMLHACFQILKDFVDKEDGDNHCDYDAHKDFVDEVRFLYDWWEKRSYNKDLPHEQSDEDDIMLIRLMLIRTQLWT